MQRRLRQRVNSVNDKTEVFLWPNAQGKMFPFSFMHDPRTVSWAGRYDFKRAKVAILILFCRRLGS